MAKVEYEGIVYDSNEELEFKHWLDEAYEAGLIGGYQKCEKGKDTFELIEKQYYWATVKGNLKKKHLLADVKYTPDFIVNHCQIIKDKPTDEKIVYVDVKGGFSQHNDTKSFQIIRKMMLKIKGIYVHKVVPEELFIKTWLPQKAGRTEVKGDIQRKYIECKTISEYMEGI